MSKYTEDLEMYRSNMDSCWDASDTPDLLRIAEGMDKEIERLKEQAAVNKEFSEQYQAEVSELKEFLKEANCALRSAAAVAQRDGEFTNWDYFRSRLAAVLLSQHKYLYPVEALGADDE